MKNEVIFTDIRKIVRALNLESKRIQREHGISIPQLLCLNLLKKRPAYKATQGELAKALNLNPSTTSGIIDRLVQKNLVAKGSSAEDKRVSIITLTALGADLLNNTPMLFHHKLESRLADLPEADLEALSTALKKLVSLLGIESVEASPIFTSGEPK